MFDPCPIQLSIKVATDDKDAMAESLLSAPTADTCVASVNDQAKSPTGPLPPLKYLPDDKEGWVTFEEPILFVYAGQGPYVGRDYMAFPVSKPDDGLIDIAVMPATSRGDMLSAIDGAERGAGFWHPSVWVSILLLFVRMLNTSAIAAVFQGPRVSCKASLPNR